MTSKWLTVEEVCAHLRVNHKRLRAAIAAGQHDAWVNYGTGAMPRYRFDAALVDTWWREVCRASASVAGGASGSSDGATRTGASGRSRTERRPSPKRTAEKSKPPSQSDVDGRLMMVARSGTSRER